jgi:hypothetical protein
MKNHPQTIVNHQNTNARIVDLLAIFRWDSATIQQLNDEAQNCLEICNGEESIALGMGHNFNILACTHNVYMNLIDLLDRDYAKWCRAQSEDQIYE